MDKQNVCIYMCVCINIYIYVCMYINMEYYSALEKNDIMYMLQHRWTLQRLY